MLRRQVRIPALHSIRVVVSLEPLARTAPVIATRDDVVRRRQEISTVTQV
jgi:hypothetical protein